MLGRAREKGHALWEAEGDTGLVAYREVSWMCRCTQGIRKAHMGKRAPAGPMQRCTINSLDSRGLVLMKKSSSSGGGQLARSAPGTRRPGAGSLCALDALQSPVPTLSPCKRVSSPSGKEFGIQALPRQFRSSPLSSLASKCCRLASHSRNSCLYTVARLHDIPVSRC